METQDSVDRHVIQWMAELPHLDPRIEAVVTRMQRIVTYILQCKKAALSDSGLKQSEYEILHELRRLGEPFRASPTELAALLGIPAATMTSRLERAEQAQLVTRVLDPADRRRLLVELTQEGRTAWENSMSEQDRVEKELIGILTDQEQDDLAALLRKVMKEVDKIRDHTNIVPGTAE
jgi:DNA-binding MarR family transcriptional regulator